MNKQELRKLVHEAVEEGFWGDSGEEQKFQVISQIQTTAKKIMTTIASSSLSARNMEIMLANLEAIANKIKPTT